MTDWKTVLWDSKQILIGQFWNWNGANVRKITQWDAGEAVIRFLSNCRRKSVPWHQSPGHYFSKAETGKKTKTVFLKNSTCQNQFRILAVFTPFLLNIQFLHGLLQSMTNSVKEIVTVGLLPLTRVQQAKWQSGQNYAMPFCWEKVRKAESLTIMSALHVQITFATQKRCNQKSSLLACM